MIETELNEGPTQEQMVRQLAIDYRIAFSSEQGIKVLEHLRYLCFDSQSSYEYQMSAMDLAFREGRRSIIKEIERQLTKPLGIQLQPTAKEEQG
jgi:hypothetical protein